jgi:hypothetical protein
MSIAIAKISRLQRHVSMTSATGFAGAECAENVALAGGAMRYRYLNYLST